jgi:hypothetical protein
MENEIYANFRDAKIIEVLKVEVNEGEGTTEDPIRRVRYLLTRQGKVIAKLGDDRERKYAGEDPMFD